MRKYDRVIVVGRGNLDFGRIPFWRSEIGESAQGMVCAWPGIMG